MGPPRAAPLGDSGHACATIVTPADRKDADADLDELAFYDQVLPQARIQEHYKRGR
ncbi:MAG: hypothetical protein IPG50_31955 [Myxococcales bacterium]|nr:hypothetical protein [Myxococcales bacterium]